MRLILALALGLTACSSNEYRIHKACSIEYADPPASAEVLVAVEQMREAMQDAMREANTSRFDSTTPLTPEQQAAADALRKSLGTQMVTYRGASMSDVVDAGVKVLLEGPKHGES